jgi:hypothetical protein
VGESKDASRRHSVCRGGRLGIDDPGLDGVGRLSVSFHVPGARRVTQKWLRTRDALHALPLASTPAAGNNGAFMIKRKGGGRWFCVATDKEGWEHVSVSIRRGDLSSVSKLPTWDEMCKVKSIFWDPDDVVVQYHPAEADYVNIHPYTLHLWRLADNSMPEPPSIMV